MIRRLPSWIWGGGTLLAMIAGMVNAVGLMGMYHHGLTHLTGAASAFAIDVAAGELVSAAQLGGLFVAFVAGATVSGTLVRNSALQLGRRYGVALMIESVFLLSAMFLLTRSIGGGQYLLAAAMGLQNAMASTYSGAIVRTTHVTGIFTDIGITLGHALRGGALEKRKLLLLLAIAMGFIFGSILGALQFARVGYATLWIPGAVTGTAGATYFIYLHHRRIGH